MSVGPMNSIGSFAGAPLAQTKGSEIDRARQDAVRHEARVREGAKAADAEGIAAADGEEKRTEDRDADGRRLWEFFEQPAANDSQAVVEPQQAPDAEGIRGGAIDLSG